MNFDRRITAFRPDLAAEDLRGEQLVVAQGDQATPGHGAVDFYGAAGFGWG